MKTILRFLYNRCQILEIVIWMIKLYQEDEPEVSNIFQFRKIELAEGDWKIRKGREFADLVTLRLRH